ncbi:DUF4251 domain-containing protein [Marseilla massiliensis]|uniref:DUF4251 domain-containing protein n=1 Tax=Marseilla massiliensis TaxID=1841864 RepID=A0A938WRN8_9BACT|nr:DUF4251 domain-containing protein [Marseilla massiliensis]MBM6673952.1 DUF4251 domain-containing protein [Marseilla massiliensis]
MKCLISLIIAVLTLASCATADKVARDERRREKAGMVAESIESGRYRVGIRTAYPIRGAAVQVTGDYGLEVSGDSVTVYLPYFGRGYTLPYGGGKGLNFKALTTEYDVRKMKRGRTRVEFSTRNDEDTYRFTVDVFDNGQVSIDVQPQQRSRISYSGELE